MNRVCLTKAGKLIEMQSGGSNQAHLDTLKNNALNAGYKEEDIEVKFVTDAEWAAIMEAQRQHEEAAESCTVKRAKAHLPIPDQLDMMYWDKINGTTNWVDYVTKIKTDIPKE